MTEWQFNLNALLAWTEPREHERGTSDNFHVDFQ
jgi:hypothetical protein